MVVEAQRDTGLGCLELEPVGKSQVIIGLFGGTVQQRLAAIKEDTKKANTSLSSDIQQLFHLRVGSLMCNMENKVEHFALKDDLVAHVNLYFTSTHS
jgi:hypothetical protein